MHPIDDAAVPDSRRPQRRRAGDRAVSRVRSRAVVGGAFVLGVAFLAGPITPAPVEAIGPLPGCELGDVYTVPRGYDDWSVTLVDRLLRVEDDYVPPDLVNVSEAGLPGGGLIRAVAIDDLRDLAEAAAANGTPIGVWSAYRSFDVQTEIFNGYANQFGFENAITYSHRPGHSEHQLGLAIDFMSAGGGNPMPGDWATTPAGAWMRDNAWEYGWVNSYPLGDPPNPLWNEKACFGYEPWQYRYLGREIAAAVHKSGLTIREYLWANYTMVDPVTGLPIPTATPTPSPTPTPDPTPTPTQAPSPTASPELSIGTPDLTGEWFGLALPLVLGLALVGLLVVLTPIALLVRRGSSGR